MPTQYPGTIPVSDLATVEPGDNDFIVGAQNGTARKFPTSRFLAQGMTLSAS